MIKLTSIAIDGKNIEVVGLTRDGSIVLPNGSKISYNIKTSCRLYGEYGENLEVGTIREALKYFDHFYYS